MHLFFFEHLYLKMKENMYEKARQKKNTGLFEFFPSDGPSRPLFRRPPSEKKKLGENMTILG